MGENNILSKKVNNEIYVSTEDDNKEGFIIDNVNYSLSDDYKDDNKPIDESNLTPKQIKMRKKYDKFFEYGRGKDIKYKGLMGIKGLKITAWIFVLFLVLDVALHIFLRFASVSSSEKTLLKSLAYLFKLFGTLALPCFMLVKFSTILKNKRSYLRFLINYLMLAIMVVCVYYVAYFHYAVNLYSKLLQVPMSDAAKMLNESFTSMLGKRIAFNLFIDMFLWSLFFFLIDYTPKKLKDKKKLLKLFRECSILPFIYVTVCFILKVLYANGNIYIHPYFCVWLPTSTPLTFIVFMRISLFITNRKKYYLSAGGTEEEYRVYIKTNAQSFHFSKVVASAFLLIGVIEILFEGILALIFDNVDVIASYSGLRECSMYIIFSPFILLFSFSKKYEKGVFDILVPLVSISVAIFIIMECIFRLVINFLG